MNKDQVMKARDAAFDSGVRLAKAQQAVGAARAVLDKAKAELDHAGVAYASDTERARKLEDQAMLQTVKDATALVDAADGLASLAMPDPVSK